MNRPLRPFSMATLLLLLLASTCHAAPVEPLSLPRSKTSDSNLKLDGGHRQRLQGKDLASVPDHAPSGALRLATLNQDQPHAAENSLNSQYRRRIEFSVMAVLVVLAGVNWAICLRRLIQKRNHAERALNEQLALTRTMIDGTPHPIYVRDRDGRLLICNAGYLDAFGVALEAVLGKTLLEYTLVSEQQSAAHHADYLQVMQDGHPLVRDQRLQLSVARSTTIYHWILPYRGSDDAVAGVIGGWIDISDRQQLIEQLQEANDLADQAKRAESDFLATLNHEIRTPMNTVIGMLELAMKKAELGIADSECLGAASDAAHGLLELIGGILDLARIESGCMPLNQQRTHLMKLVESTIRVFEAMAEQKGLLMSFELDSRINTDVLIDPVRFKQILSNLLSNAIKLTECGHVRLSVLTSASRNGERLNLCVQVEDTGIGISQEHQLHLFSPFPPGPQAKPYTGADLGLVISHRLCEMMGGMFTLQSTPGNGTCIKMQLDVVTLLSMTPSQMSEGTPPHQPRALKVLIVEDYPPNRRLLMQQLSYLGHTAIEAQGGAQALEAWRTQRFDMILTTCAMPVMDGYELTRLIRKEETANGNLAIQIVGLIANAQSDEVERCLSAGMDDCLLKPISLHDLQTRLTSVEPSPVVPKDELALSSDKLIDLEALERLTHGDVDALERLVEPLIDSMEDELSALMKAFTRKDLPGIRTVAHKVKIGARMIKARHLAQCCEYLEQACLAPNWNRLTERVDEQYEAMVQVLEMIGGYRK